MQQAEAGDRIKQGRSFVWFHKSYESKRRGEHGDVVKNV